MVGHVGCSPRWRAEPPEVFPGSAPSASGRQDPFTCGRSDGQRAPNWLCRWIDPVCDVIGSLIDYWHKWMNNVRVSTCCCCRRRLIGSYNPGKTAGDTHKHAPKTDRGIQINRHKHTYLNCKNIVWTHRTRRHLEGGRACEGFQGWWVNWPWRATKRPQNDLIQRILCVCVCVCASTFIQCGWFLRPWRQSCKRCTADH